MELKQSSRNFSRYHYTIEEDGIRLNRKGITSSSETFVEIENIGNKKISEKSRKIIWLIISIFWFLIAIAVFYNRMNGGKVGNGAEIFHLSMSLIFFIIYLMTIKNVLYLTQSDNTNAIEFLGTKFHREKVNEDE